MKFAELHRGQRNTVHVLAGNLGPEDMAPVSFISVPPTAGKLGTRVKLYAQADASARMAVDGDTVQCRFWRETLQHSFGGQLLHAFH